MFKRIIDFFLWGLGFYKGKKCWNYADLYYQIERGNGTLPLSFDRLPFCLSMQSAFWHKAKELYDYTLQDRHEYAVSVWWAVGDIVFTPPQRGDERSVTTNYSLQVRYEPVDEMYANKTVYVDTQVVFTQSIKYEDIPHNGKLAMLFHLHTHPPHYIGEEQPENRAESFFSAVDVQGFLQSNSAIFGVITDKVYLMVKPSNVINSGLQFTDYDITPEFLTKNLHIAVYQGSWNDAVFEKIGTVA